jgi:hypothetical protein
MSTKSFAYFQSTFQAIFVKSKTPISSAKRNSPPSNESLVFGLGLFSTGMISGMGEFKVRMMLGRIDGILLIERHTKGFIGGQAL